MQKNQSNAFSCLSKLTKEVGLLSIRSDQINSDVKQLVKYLANGKVKADFWLENTYPKYIFTEQFSEQLLIIICSSNKTMDNDFIKPFIKNKKILTFDELQA